MQTAVARRVAKSSIAVCRVSRSRLCLPTWGRHLTKQLHGLPTASRLIDIAISDSSISPYQTRLIPCLRLRNPSLLARSISPYRLVVDLAADSLD